MFLDESAFDMDDDLPPSRSHFTPKQSYGLNNSSSSSNKNNDLSIMLDEDMEDLSISGLGSAGGIGTSSASRARFLAQQRELNLKKQQQKIAQSGMIRSSVESTTESSSGQFTPSVRQFSAPKAVRETESDFSRHQNNSKSPSGAFSPQTDKGKPRRDDESTPNSRTERRVDRFEDRDAPRKQTSRTNEYDDDRRSKPRDTGSRREKSKNPEGWVDDRDDYDRRGGSSRSKRKDDEYDDDYGRSGRGGGGRGDRVESRRGDTGRRGKDESSDEEDRYGRKNRADSRNNRSRSPPARSSGRRRDDYDDRDDDRRKERPSTRDDSRDERRSGKGGDRPKKRDDDYEEDNRRERDRTERDRDQRDRRQKTDPDNDRDRRSAPPAASARPAGRDWNEEYRSGDEDSEAPEKWSAAGRAEREANGMVGPGSRAGGDRNTGPPPSMPIVELDLSDMTRFLMRPLPRGAGVVQCHIVRNKSGTNKLYPIYSLYLKENDRFLMCSKKRPNNKTSNYLISKKENDLARDSPNYLGKLRSNFVGTEFQVFDNGTSPDDEDKDGGESSETRRELGAITYAPNVLGSRGPRKMQAVIPAVDESNTIMSWRQHRGSEGEMLQRIKDRNFKDLYYFINKPPRWNEQVGAYVLNFSGRVTMASVKNFQLVDPDEQNAIILQFGRVGKDQFTMDMQWPMSPFQAFAITLSSFDSKIACD